MKKDNITRSVEAFVNFGKMKKLPQQKENFLFYFLNLQCKSTSYLFQSLLILVMFEDVKLAKNYI